MALSLRISFFFFLMEHGEPHLASINPQMAMLIILPEFLFFLWSNYNSAILTTILQSLAQVSHQFLSFWIASSLNTLWSLTNFLSRLRQIWLDKYTPIASNSFILSLRVSPWRAIPSAILASASYLVFLYPSLPPSTSCTPYTMIFSSVKSDRSYWKQSL